MLRSISKFWGNDPIRDIFFKHAECHCFVIATKIGDASDMGGCVGPLSLD